jgi:hypothetical protein
MQGLGLAPGGPRTQLRRRRLACIGHNGRVGGLEFLQDVVLHHERNGGLGLVFGSGDEGGDRVGRLGTARRPLVNQVSQICSKTEEQEE